MHVIVEINEWKGVQDKETGPESGKNQWEWRLEGKGLMEVWTDPGEISEWMDAWLKEPIKEHGWCTTTEELC